MSLPLGGRDVLFQVPSETQVKLIDSIFAYAGDKQKLFEQGLLSLPSRQVGRS